MTATHDASVRRPDVPVVRQTTGPPPPLHHAYEALQMVPQTAAILAAADVAAVLIRCGDRHVLVSRWGSMRFPLGLRSHGLPDALTRSVAASAFHPLRHGGREIGLLWVGRLEGPAFDGAARRILRLLAEVTTLTLLPSSPWQVPAAARGGDDEPQRPMVAGDLPPRPRKPSSRMIDGADLMVPAFPTSLTRIVALTEDSETSPAELVAAVSVDPLLVTQVMRIAGSPGFGRARAPTTVRDALVVLGLRGVRNVAIGQFARSLYAHWGPVDQLLWEQALGTAVGMHLIHEARDPAAAEDGYLVGLLHNVAMIALHNADPTRFAELVATAAGDPTPWATLEEELFGTQSLALLPRLLASWHLPPRVARALRELANGETDDLLVPTFRWAWPTALEVNTAWRRIADETPIPAWLARAREIGDRQLGMSLERATELTRTVAMRCEALRQLVG